MGYDITKSNGKLITKLEDYAVDNSTSITLVGRGVSNYGQKISENMIYLLENFANTSAPLNPTDGQLWFRTFNNDNPSNVFQENRLYIFYNNQWNDIGMPLVQDDQPSDPFNGELWFNTNDSMLYYYLNNSWRMSSNIFTSENPPSQLSKLQDGTLWLMLPEGITWVYDNSIQSPIPQFQRFGGSNDGNNLEGSWRLIGPKIPTNSKSYSYYIKVYDTSGNTHYITVNEYDGNIMSIDSSDEFILDKINSNIVDFNSYDKNLVLGNDKSTQIYSGNTQNAQIKGYNQYYGGFSLVSYNLNNFDPNDVIGRGSNTDTRPTYPVNNELTDLGSQTNRWRVVYALSIDAIGMNIGGDAVATQKWTTNNFIKRTDDNTNNYNLDMAGKTISTGYCWFHDSTNNTYNYLPDIIQVKSICLPLDIGGDVTGNIYSSINTSNNGGNIGSSIKGSYINNYSYPETVNKLYSAYMSVKSTGQDNTSMTLNVLGWEGLKTWNLNIDGTITDPSGNIISNNSWVDDNYVKKTKGTLDYSPMEAGINKESGNIWLSYSDINGKIQYVYAQNKGDYISTIEETGNFQPVTTIQIDDTTGNMGVHYKSDGSGWVTFQPSGDYALRTELPTAGTITNGTYTKIPMNDGSGKSVVVQSFTVLAAHMSTINLPITMDSSDYQITLSTAKDSPNISSSHAIGFLNNSKTPTSFIYVKSWISDGGAGNEHELQETDIVVRGIAK